MVEVVMREKPTEADVLFDLDKENKISAQEGVEVEVENEPETPIDNSGLDVIIDGDETPDEVKYEERTEQKQEESPQEKTFKPKKKKLAHERVRQVLYEKKAMQNAAYSLLEENKALKRQLEQKEKAANAWHGDSMKIRALQAQKLYMQAIEDGDAQKQADAQRDMIHYETELNEQQRREKNHQSFNYDEDVFDYVGDVAPPTPYEEFILENEWYDANSAYYDPDKVEIAREYDKQLVSELHKQGYSRRQIENAIQTKEYFDLISNYVDEAVGGNYGYRGQDSDDGYEEEYEALGTKPDHTPSVQRVAPVNRSNTAQTYSNTPSKSNSRKVKLSPEQTEWALSLDYGYPVSQEEKIKRYAASVRSNKE